MHSKLSCVLNCHATTWNNFIQLLTKSLRKKICLMWQNTHYRSGAQPALHFEGGNFHEISFDDVIVLIQLWYNFFANGQPTSKSNRQNDWQKIIGQKFRKSQKFRLTPGYRNLLNRTFCNGFGPSLRFTGAFLTLFVHLVQHYCRVGR